LIGDEVADGAVLVVAQSLRDELGLVAVDGRDPVGLVGDLVVNPPPELGGSARVGEFERVRLLHLAI
jgi:hypothetical protein